MQPEGATASGAGTPQEPHLYDWQLRAKWEFKSLDEIPDDAEHKVLPAAEQFSSRHRARIVLPSGSVLEVDATVLLDYCHALRPHATELLERVLWISYLPAAHLWEDQWVEEFFEKLHHDRLRSGYFSDSAMGMSASYGALIHALSVQTVKEAYTSAAKLAISKVATGRWLFEWLGGYQLFNSAWKKETLFTFYYLSTDMMRLWTAGDNKRRMLEAFTTQDLLNLAYSRWGRAPQPVPSSPPPASEKRARPLGEVVLARAKHLLPCMQLKVVISDDFSIICTRNVAEQKSPFISESPVDEDGPLPTIYLPFASSFSQEEVLEFFTLVDNGYEFAESSKWKLSWVQLADHLQMSEALDKAAKWVWNADRIGMLLEWLPLTKLRSMQQRRPEYPLVENEAQSLLARGTITEQQKIRLLCEALRQYGMKAVEELSMDIFLDLLPVQLRW